MSICVNVNAISKRYKEKTAVDHLSFNVRKGEVFGLLGHNGAGKSTAIDCILGLTKTNGGSSEIFGKNPKRHRKTLFEKVGVQLQESSYQNNIKVKEVCEETAALYKNPSDYHHILHRLKLNSFLNQKVEQLSGGERQKLSIAVALIPDPELIFLDELTTGLDAAARREVWQILKMLKKEGMTIFLTTHYMEEAEVLCDHILLLKNGKNIAEGSVKEIIGQSPYEKLEEAYLWYMGEEQLV